MAAAAWAQTGVAVPNVADATSPAPKEPGHALVHSRLGNLVESVNPANGQLSLRYALPLPPGMGFTPKFAIAYESTASNYLGNLAGGAQQTMLASNGWSYTAPVLTYAVAQLAPDPGNFPDFTCTVTNDYVLQTGDGAHHQLALSTAAQTTAFNQFQVPPQPPCGSDPNNPSHPNYYQQVTSAAAQGYEQLYFPPQQGSSVLGAVTAADAAGTTLLFLAAQNPEYGALVSTITDRNGNQAGYRISNASTQGITLADTQGRAALVTSGFAQSGGDSLAVSGVGTPYCTNWETVNGSMPATISTACPTTTLYPAAPGAAVLTADAGDASLLGAAGACAAEGGIAGIEVGPLAVVTAIVGGVAAVVVLESRKGGGRNAAAKGGLPADAIKLKGDQGYRDGEGNRWKKDQLHKDHWDVIDRSGK